MKRGEKPAPNIMGKGKLLKYHYKNFTNSASSINRNEMTSLTELAIASVFHCTFCFRTFPSAQAMGGHQNAHKVERAREKKLFVKDVIGYRKRTYLSAMKANDYAKSSKMVNLMSGNSNNPANIPTIPNMSGDLLEPSDCNGKTLRMFFPIKELSLAENVGVHARAGEDKSLKDCDCGGCGPSSKDLDLTLRL